MSWKNCVSGSYPSNSFLRVFSLDNFTHQKSLNFRAIQSLQHILNGLRRLPEDMMRVAQFLGVG